MDQVRNFTQANRGSIVNIIYIIAAVVLVYYLVMYYFNTEEKDKVLLRNKISTSVPLDPLVIAKANETKFRLKSEYTISFWLYINNYNNSNKDNFMGVLSIFDEKKLKDKHESVLFVGLHPTMPKMIIRPGCILNSTSSDNLVKYNITGTETAWAGDGVTANSDTMNSLTPCDVMDIDMQRWICVAVSVNGRIMDVYLDGKLARSCIMDNVQDLGSTTDSQVVHLFHTANTFNGYVSGVQISNYAVTPDVIYGRYQAGPYFSTGFMDYLVDKLGVRISYQGTGNATTTGTVASFFGLV